LLLRLLTVFSSAEAAAHGLELLHLVGRKNLRQLIVCVLEYRLGLLTPLILGQGGIAAEFGHLLLLRGEDRLKLRCLVGGEIEALAKMGRGLLGIHLAVAAMVSMLSGGLLGGGIARGLGRLLGRLSECRGGDQSDCQGGVEKNAFHVSAAPCGNAALPDVLME
jgi:hypothetical protein